MGMIPQKTLAAAAAIMKETAFDLPTGYTGQSIAMTQRRRTTLFRAHLTTDSLPSPLLLNNTTASGPTAIP